MFKKFDMESMRTATTPYEVPEPKSKDELDDAVNVHLYRSMIGSLLYLTASRPDIMFASTLGCSILRMNAVSCGFLLYAVQIVSRPSMLLVVSVFLLVVLIHADGWVLTGSCTIPTGSYSFMLMDGFLLDDHNKAAYLEKGKGWEAYEQILDFLNRSYIRYTLAHRPPIVFNSLVKQFWATATMRTLEAGPSEIIATIVGNEVVVTESLIRTQLQLNDENGLYEFTLHDVLDGMREIGEPTPSPVREPTTFREPTPDSPRPPSPPPYPRSAEVGPTTSTRLPSPTRQTSFQEDISKGGGDY
nr:copia protein [Tanacetum cinerariifolium]